MIDLTTYALLRKQIATAASGISDVRAEGDELVFVLVDGHEVRMAIPATEIRDAVVRDDVLVLTLADGKEVVVDATLTQSGQAADAKVTGDVVSQLKDEIDYLHPLVITSFSVTPNLAEKGSTLSSETFAFAVNRLGAVLTLEDQTVSGSSASRADTLTSDKTYTLKAVLNSVTKTATASIKFVAPVYYGVSASYTLEDATVLALTRALTTSRSRTFTVNAASGQYILYALPASLGTPTFKVGGFEGGFTLVGTFDFTNSSGHTESYNLYRTVNAGLGSTSVAVS